MNFGTTLPLTLCTLLIAVLAFMLYREKLSTRRISALFRQAPLDKHTHNFSGHHGEIAKNLQNIQSKVHAAEKVSRLSRMEEARTSLLQKNQGILQVEIEKLQAENLLRLEYQSKRQKEFLTIEKEALHLRHSNLELLRSNDALSEFAYTASHDLQSPLRAIGTLVDWIQKDPSNQLSEESLQNFSLLKKRTQRLSQLLTSLLTYATVDQFNEPDETLPLSPFLAELFGSLHNPNLATLNLEQLKHHQICTSRLRLTVVFQNLLSNAIKFCDKSNGQITVLCLDSEVPGFYKISVADNGQGIPEKHHNTIFEMFRSLIPKDQVEGSGLGLSIAKKIIEAQGGKIWVESHKDFQGATLSFLWKK